MDRRNFLKNSCTFCLTTASSLSIISFLQSCATINTLSANKANNTVVVPFSELDSKDSLILKIKESEYDVAMIKTSSGQWKALQMLCTHQSNPIFFNGSYFRCNVHFSEFNKEGIPQNGPASKPLRLLPIEKNSDSYSIKLL